MKYIITLIILAICSIVYCQVNPNNHYVKGYTRSDGTKVKGYYRTNPNSTNRDNYTTKPNINPYTGKKGYIQPDNKLSPTNTYYSPSLSYSKPLTNSYDNFRIDSTIYKAKSSTKYSYQRPSNNLNTYNVNHTSYPYNIDYVEIRERQEKWMNEEYPKIKAEQERWMREEYPKIQAEQERWMREEYPKIKIQQDEFLKSFYRSSYSGLTSIQAAINYHNQFSYQDKLIIERALSKLGYNIGIKDGIFDANTIHGIKKFQKNVGLGQDGKVGKQTLKKLEEQFR